MAKSLKRMFIVTISGVAGTWSQSTGGGISAEYTKDFDGGATVPTLILGALPEAEDLVLTRVFDPVRDLPIIARMRPYVGRGAYTINKVATDANMVRVGKPLIYRGSLKGITHPESDSNSSDTAPFSITFATNGLLL